MMRMRKSWDWVIHVVITIAVFIVHAVIIGLLMWATDDRMSDKLLQAQILDAAIAQAINENLTAGENNESLVY